MSGRTLCQCCLRPAAFCVCALLPTLTPRTRIVILQHPREAGLAICSARLTIAALVGSELHVGIRFGDHPRVRALCAEPGTALLFPGEGAVPASRLTATPPATLLVLDGNWPQALKMLRDNPQVAALPRVSIEAAAPSSYGGLRREPEAGHLATIDAVAEALAALEGDPARYAPLREAFRRSVELQVACARGERRSPRHRPGWRPSED
jgi:DTW domain-containing protein YfiP